MDYSQAVTLMRQYFHDNFSSADIYLPDQNADPQEGLPWVRFNILHGDGRQVSMGDPSNNRFERRGVITIQIFTPQGDNSVSATTLADEILKLYEGVDINGILYFDAYAREVGNDGRGWYQINVLTSFKYENIT